MGQPQIDLSPKVSDEVRQTTCYMCACRCGINVHLRDGRIRYIEGNRNHPVNRGVLCAKGSAGIMQHYSPARLSKPLLRVGERGAGEFREIEWEEALALAAGWLRPIRERDPRKLAFFTGRDQSQALTGWWAQQFGTPNFAAHGGFCSVNMATAGIYTFGGSFWEFGEPDWERAKYLMIFGVAEDHDSNPIKIGLSKLRAHGAKIVGVNPVRTGYNAIADEWIGITPGTDGLFVLAIVHELLRTGRIDRDYLARYTNAAWLVIQDPDGAEDGLFARDAEGVPLVFDEAAGGLAPHKAAGAKVRLEGEVALPDGRRAVPVFALLSAKYAAPDYAPERAAEPTGVPAATIRRIAEELARTAFEEEIVLARPWTDWKGERHETMIGRPVAFHAMRGISAHSNGFQTCRSLHLLQILLGSIDCPGGFRFQPPYPKPAEAHPRPSGNAKPNTPLAGSPLGYPLGPEHLLLEADGLTPQRIDKAYSWEAPLSAHGLMQMVIANAAAGDPYEIDVLFLYMANMAWNSSMNTAGTMAMLTEKRPDGEYVIPKIIYSDAYASEMVAYADLILPDTTYLERHDCISLLDRPISDADAAADAIRWPVLQPDRDVRGFQSVLLDLGARLGLPGFVDADGKAKYRDYADYIVNHERKPGIGPLAGFRGNGSQSGRGSANPSQLDRYIENGGFWTAHIPEEALYFKHANAAYQDWAVGMGLYDSPQPVVFQLYLEPLAKFRLAARGKTSPRPPEHVRPVIERCFDPLPAWYPPFEGDRLEQRGEAGFPFHAITQRPMAMYHSWGSQNAWLRQIHARNALYVPGALCDELGLATGDWVWLSSHHARIKVQIARMDATNGKTVWTWNAIGKRSGAWGLEPDAPEAEKGFLVNHLIRELLPEQGDGLRWANADPITGQAAWFDLRVNIEKAEAEPAATEPRFAVQRRVAGQPASPSQLRYGQEW